jgi:acyl-CoA thioesterase
LDFDADISLRPGAGDALEGEIVEGWETPRGPLGGYVMAIVVNGMQIAVDDESRQARSITVHFLRPPHAGPITVHPVVERAGRSLTTVSARMEQDGKVIALALGAFSVPWESPDLDDAPMPSVGPPDPSRPPIGPLPNRPTAPTFTGRLTMQWRFGDPPFSSADRAEVGGWLGLRQERALDAPAIALLADAWFPAPWPRLAELAPAPTIDLTVHFRAPLPVADTLLLGRFRSSLTRDGFFDEDGELWTPDGVLVAQSRQLGLLIGAQI